MHPTACAHSLHVLVTADLSLNLAWEHKAEHCRTVIRSKARQIIPEVKPVEAIRRPLAYISHLDNGVPPLRFRDEVQEPSLFRDPQASISKTPLRKQRETRNAR
jgi:hypothetical protein